MKASVKVVFITIILTAGVMLTGCGNFFKYYLRTAPDNAMEKYLEEKYDDDVTCLDWGSEYGFSAYWNRGNFGGTFSSEKYPGVEFSCGSSLINDGWDYTFYDDYQREVYLSGVQEIMEGLAAKYFEGLGMYYVVVEPSGMTDDETVEEMSFEEYSRRYKRYGVDIYIEEMSDTDAIGAFEKLIAEAQSQGFQHDFFLGRANTNIVTEEWYHERLLEEDYDRLWKGNGIECCTKSLYRYTLPLTEGEDEPYLYVITEEEE